MYSCCSRRNSLEEFIRLDRPLAKRFRLSTVHASGEIYRRHASFFRGFPWCLAVLVDDRVSDASKQVLSHRFHTLPPCSLRPGVAQKIAELGLAAGSLLSQPWLN